MKSFVAVLALVAVAAADVSHVVGHHDESKADIVSQSSDVQPDGYGYGYQTSNGITAQESGVLQNPGRDDEGIAVIGSNSYPAPDGQVISLTYTADANGYHPEGAHLPTPPPPQPIPEYIVRSLAYNAAHPPAPEKPYKA